MRRVSSLAPTRARRGSGLLLRLAACLAMLHAGGHAASGEASGGYGTNAVGEHGGTHVRGSGIASGGGAAFAGAHGDGKREGGGGAPARPVIAARKAAEPVGRDAGEAAGDETADGDKTAGDEEASGPAVECSGRRFKKCR